MSNYSQDVDIVGQLAALQSSLDKIQRQLANKSQEDSQIHAQYQLKLQSLESKHTDMEASLQALHEQVQTALSHHSDQMNDLRHTTKTMLSQVVTRIADQFDAVQSSFEDVLASHTKDQEELLAAMEVASAETKQWSEQRITQLSSEVTTQKDQVQSLVALKLEEHSALLQTALADHKEKQLAAEELMQQALNVWQQSMEGRLNDALAKLGEYTLYTSRLRREIKQLQDDNTAINTALVEALAKELSGMGEGISLLQKDAAGLLTVTHKVVA